MGQKFEFTMSRQPESSRSGLINWGGGKGETRGYILMPLNGEGIDSCESPLCNFQAFFYIRLTMDPLVFSAS